jgi:predicted DCC family thiol-disulfide oxidoreductase YuxK
MGNPAPAEPLQNPNGDLAEKPTVFFDGVCGLCNGFVDFVMARDPGGVFRFAALQGETAAIKLGRALRDNPESDTAGLRSIVFCDENQIYRKSEAVLRIVATLGGIWTLARLLQWVPKTLSDAVYDFVARNRYRWFGKREACRLPSPVERTRFLP